MRTLLVHPPAARHGYGSGVLLQEPLGALYLGPALAPRHEVRFVDLRITPRLDRALGGFRPEAAVVGMTLENLTSVGGALADLRARFPGIRILLTIEAAYGNSFLAERPAEFLHPDADAMATGYFFATQRRSIPAALDAWEEGRPLDAVPGLLLNRAPGSPFATPALEDRIGDIGAADRRLLGVARGRYRFGGIANMAFLFYVFGCRHKCRFCPMSKHDGSISVRSVDEVVRELAEMTEPHVFLQDYEPFSAPAAMAALADAIERAGIRKEFFLMTRADAALANRSLLERWRKIGLRWLYLGLDGHSPARLREIRKGVSVETNEAALRMVEEMGIGVAVGFPVAPEYTRADFAELRDYVTRLHPPLVDFTVETPVGGTRLFDDSEARLTTRDWSLFDLHHAVVPTALPLDEFYREMTKLHLLAGRLSWRAMWRHYPLRDFVRLWFTGTRSLVRSWRAARDHEPPGMGGDRRAVRVGADFHFPVPRPDAPVS